MTELLREIIRAELEEQFGDRAPTRAELTEMFVKFGRAMLPPPFDVEVYPGSSPNSITVRLVHKKRQ